ncbi:MAG: ATP-dependent helicase HrpA [Patescibacteria group bacterium]|nr:ATP-dependent helicase HrpA [Patescibacteria group bacterium]
MASDSFDLAREIDHHGGWDEATGVATGVALAEHGSHFAYPPERLEPLGNPELPVANFKDRIVDVVADNPVTIIVAETGAGKSTQVPQYLFEAGYDTVYVTQPRRAAARNVATRIREEVSLVHGELGGQDLVSFQTAGERDGPEYARIKVVTDGLQLVKELHDKGFGTGDVLVIDEVHEWNTNIEVLVAWTKRAIKQNPGLRVVIMSATMDAEHLSDYYEEVSHRRPPIIEIPGRNHHVEKVERPESTVVDEVIKIVNSIPNEEAELPADSTGILVFEPGKREIQEAMDNVRARLPKNLIDKVKIFPLHAKLSQEEQQAALAEYPGYIKIVVATEVAQTSLTISDIKYVVDSGYQRRMEIDHEGTPSLRLVPISQADCEQRAGRTGRVGDGFYVLTAMDKSTPHVMFNKRERFPTSEIRRTDVSRHMLRLGEVDLDIAEFDMYHDVTKHTIELAEHNLRLLGALDDDVQITYLGSEMNLYPLCTSSARIMVEAQRYQEETRACLAAIVAAKEAGGLQYFGHEAGQRWRELTSEKASDLLVQLDLFVAAQTMTDTQLKDNDLDIDNVKRAREIYYKVTRLARAERQILEPPDERTREDVKICAGSGFVTSIYKHDGDGDYVHAFNPWPTRRTLSKRSIVTVAGGAPDWVVGDPYAVESRDQSELRHFVENVTVVTSYELGRIAAASVTQESQGYYMHDGTGTYVERFRHMLFGIDLGVVEERTPEPSPALRHAIIEHVLSNPGSAQKELRATKKELEHLSRIAKDHVPKLTHDQIIALIHEAAPADVTHPAEVEDNLRAMLHDPERKLSLDDFVPPYRREQIIADAPEVIEVAGGRIHLKYQRGKPIASHFSDAHILALTEEVLLPDGRSVMFSYPGDKKKHSLHEIQEKIRNQDDY